MTIDTIAVLGGGNGSITMAGDLALAGFKIRMWTAFPQEFDNIYDAKTIRLKGRGRIGDAKIDEVTRDLEEAVKGAQVICCPTPAFAQENIANQLGPHLEDGQILFLSPGSLGSYLCGKVFKENGHWRDIAIAEPGTLPYLTRKTDTNEVLVSGHTVRLPVGVFPARKTEEAVSVLRKLYPAIHPVENALSIALLNVGPIIHAPLMLLNTGPIEHFKSWDIHNEGTTASVKKMILAHDQERIAVRRALGLTSHHYAFSDHYDQNSENEWMYGRKAHDDLVDSQSWREALDFNYRYIQEDVKCNLALLCSLGDLGGVDTPIADALLQLIGVIAGENYAKTGRSLDYLGLSGMGVTEIVALLEKGF